jgi:MFS family permease
MGYMKELLLNWRALVAALIGLGTGFSFTNTTASIMGTRLVEDLGWSMADFAAVNSLSLVMLLAFPVVGRLTDVIGVRRTALIGFITLPLSFIGLSQMDGSINTYKFYFLVQAVLCITTTATVFSRVVVQYIEKARGLALAIVASGPALTGAIVGPLLNTYVETNGWREGYIALAVFCAVGGAIALLLLPRERKIAGLPGGPSGGELRRDYAEIVATRAFWVMLGAMLLCNLPQVLVLSQLTLLLRENGVDAGDAGVMISAFSIGMLVGRFSCGLALDRFPASVVSAIAMGLPSIGLWLLASNLDTPPVLTFSVFLLGLSYGAEGDLVGYLVSRNFNVQIFSSVLGLMTAAIATSSAAGAILLSISLAKTGNYVVFLVACGVAVLLGSLLFLMLKGQAAPVHAASRSSVGAAE